MDTQNRPAAMKQVTEAFAAWKAVHDKVVRLEKSCKLALKEDGTGVVPIELQAELAGLRIDSDRLLLVTQQALLKIKTPRSSRESGDSTWS
jgi:hypothetical protein